MIPLKPPIMAGLGPLLSGFIRSHIFVMPVLDTGIHVVPR
jgi:hypothetical protein